MYEKSENNMEVGGRLWPKPTSLRGNQFLLLEPRPVLIPTLSVVIALFSFYSSLGGGQIRVIKHSDSEPWQPKQPKLDKTPSTCSNLIHPIHQLKSLKR